jgi:hypothetical protein
MTGEFRSYQDNPRSVKLAIKRDLADRVVGIVTERHPEPVLVAEVQARITAETPTVDTAEGKPLGMNVPLGHTGVVWYAIQTAMEKKQIVTDSWGDQAALRLPNDPYEAGHITM